MLVKQIFLKIKFKKYFRLIINQTYVSGITSNKTRYAEFAERFDDIAPITFYYDNSPSVDFITKSIRRNYFNSNPGTLTDNDHRGLLEVSKYI